MTAHELRALLRTLAAAAADRADRVAGGQPRVDRDALCVWYARAKAADARRRPDSEEATSELKPEPSHPLHMRLALVWAAALGSFAGLCVLVVVLGTGLGERRTVAMLFSWGVSLCATLAVQDAPISADTPL